MSHPAIERLSSLLPAPEGGGDAVDWDRIAEAQKLRLPDDYREFVTLYGGGEVDEYLSVSTPPVAGSPYGDLLDRLSPRVPTHLTDELAAMLESGTSPHLLPFADTASGDVAFWLRSGDPGTWTVAVFRRQSLYGGSSWSLFDGGMADFLVAVLEGTCQPFSQQIPTAEPHVFDSWR